jgi:hypothetical protein
MNILFENINQIADLKSDRIILQKIEQHKSHEITFSRSIFVNKYPKVTHSTKNSLITVIKNNNSENNSAVLLKIHQFAVLSPLLIINHEVSDFSQLQSFDKLDIGII